MCASRIVALLPTQTIQNALSSTSAEVSGSAAFKSKSDRKTDGSLREVGDPGAYQPYNGNELANTSRRTFNKSQMTGAGGFGTREARGAHEAQRCAGARHLRREASRSSRGETGSSFASQTKRGAYLPKAQTPGAGEYDPSYRQERMTGGDSMFKNRDERFRKSIELEYAAHVGPGSYSAGDYNSIASRSRLPWQAVGCICLDVVARRSLHGRAVKPVIRP